MPSSIAWLDTTAEEQRLARDLISLFSQTESRDELGIGQIRDAFSDALFPGTSVIQTRARYFLFVPWCYTTGSARGASGERCHSKGQGQERNLIKTFLEAGFGDASGLIGSRVGPTVKTLPSAIYWNGMRSYGIVNQGTDLSHLGLHLSHQNDESEELTERTGGDWHAGLPAPPAGFPAEIEGGFALTRPEADWLAERIVSRHPDSLLAHLVLRRKEIPVTASFPWAEISRSKFPPLEHGYWFSSVMHGASLLYNLILAEEYDRHPELTRLDSLVEEYQDKIEAWETDFLGPQRAELEAWDLQKMWAVVEAINPRIHPLSKAFVGEWVTAIRSAPATGIADNKGLRQLVEKREKRKNKQSRLLNPKMLATWSGAAGSGQLNFRWPAVVRIVNDIQVGLASTGGTPHAGS